MYHSVVLFIGCISLVFSARHTSRIVLDCIFAFALIANSGVLPFSYSFVVNSVCAIVGLLAARLGKYHEPFEDAPTFWFLSFWMIAGHIFVTIASASIEYYVRRRYVFGVMFS